MVDTVGNEHTLVNVKRRCDSLGKDVGDIIVRVGAVVELGAEGALPFLSGNFALSIRSVEDEALEL
jgi:hypothetical protein